MRVATFRPYCGDRFCVLFMELVAASNILEEDFYDRVFDVRVRIEDSLEDSQTAVHELYRLASSPQSGHG